MATKGNLSAGLRFGDGDLEVVPLARGAGITATLRSSCSPLSTLCPPSMPCPIPLALHTLSLACGPAPRGCYGATACPGEEEPRSLHSATQSLPRLLISLVLWTSLVQEGKLRHKAGRCHISVGSRPRATFPFVPRISTDLGRGGEDTSCFSTAYSSAWHGGRSLPFPTAPSPVTQSQSCGVEPCSCSSPPSSPSAWQVPCSSQLALA